MDRDFTERQCPACGLAYVADPARLRHGRQTTCSRACSYRLRGERKETKTRLACSACGKEMERSPSRIKGKHGDHFCSRSCHYAGRSAGLSGRTVVNPYRISVAAHEAWKIGAAKTVVKRRTGDKYQKSEETRAKLSAATARALAEGKIGVPSKIEGVVAEQLERLGASFVRQHPIRDAAGRFAFVLDFWFPDHSVAIEVNGTYWHGDPRVYPVARNAMQARAVERYRRKLDGLAEMDIRVIELWELDLKRNPSQAVLEAYTMATTD